MPENRRSVPEDYMYRKTLEQGREALRGVPEQSGNSAPAPDGLTVLKETVARKAYEQAQKDVSGLDKQSRTEDNGNGSIDKLIQLIDTQRTIHGYPLKINIGQQNKHISGTNQYKTSLSSGQTRSILYGDSNTIQELLINNAGKGVFLTNNKERIDFGQVIGKYIDPNTKREAETTIGIIHYGKNGAHIVPARPKLGGNG